MYWNVYVVACICHQCIYEIIVHERICDVHKAGSSTSALTSTVGECRMRIMKRKWPVHFYVGYYI